MRSNRAFARHPKLTLPPGWFILANFLVLQLLVAAITENFQWSEERKKAYQRELFESRNAPILLHQAWFERWNPYRWQEAKPRAITRQHLPSDAFLPWEERVKDESRDTGAPAQLALGVVNRFFDRFEGRQADAATSAASISDESGLAEILDQNPSMTIDVAQEALRIRRRAISEFILDHPGYDVSLFVFDQSSLPRQWCQAIVPSSYEERIFGRPRPNRFAFFTLRALVLAAIAISIVTSAVATPSYRTAYQDQRTAWFTVGSAPVFCERPC